MKLYIQDRISSRIRGKKNSISCLSPIELLNNNLFSERPLVKILESGTNTATKTRIFCFCLTMVVLGARQTTRRTFGALKSLPLTFKVEQYYVQSIRNSYD